MPLIPLIPIATMAIPELLAAHNGLAKTRAVPKLKCWHGSRCELATRVALLRTVMPIPPKPPRAKKKAKTKRNRSPAWTKRPQLIRSEMLKALAIVTHYEDSDGNKVGKKNPRAHAVGLPYNQVLRIVRKRFPKSKVNAASLWWTVNKAVSNTPGFECKLPHRRPRSK